MGAFREMCREQTEPPEIRVRDQLRGFLQLTNVPAAPIRWLCGIGEAAADIEREFAEPVVAAHEGP